MIDSVILDVCIGMVFFYLLVSLVISGITELISVSVKMRPGFLKVGVSSLLGKELSEELFRHPLIAAYSRLDPEDSIKDKIFSGIMRGIAKILSWMFNPYARSWIAKGNAPSYLSPDTFSMVVLDLLRKKKENGVIGNIRAIINSENEPPAGKIGKIQMEVGVFDSRNDTRIDAIRNLVNDASAADQEKTLRQISDLIKKNGDAGMIGFFFRHYDTEVLMHPENQGASVAEISRLYSETMERVTGWYKRWSQGVIFVLSFFAACALNADSIMIANVLFTQPAVREAVIAQATQTIKNAQDSTPATQDEAGKEVGSPCSDCTPLTAIEVVNKNKGQIGAPVGWKKPTSSLFREPQATPDTLLGWVVKLFGLLATALAVSFGAPFWFDMLNHLVNLRGAGSRPGQSAAKEKEEKS